MATETAQQIIEARAPQYIGDPRVPDYIALATKRTGTVFGDCTQLAIALRALHMLALADRGSSITGAAGPIRSEKEGKLERSYGVSASASAKNPDLAQTSWGLELLNLRSSYIIGYRNSFI